MDPPEQQTSQYWKHGMIISIVVIITSFALLALFCKIRRNKSRNRNTFFDESVNFTEYLNASSASRLSALQRKLQGNPCYIDTTKDIKDQADNLSFDSKREIHRSAFKLGTELGSGNFGEVHKGELVGLYDTESSTNVAIKSNRSLATENDLCNFLCEIKVMGFIKPHLNLVSMIGSCASELKELGKIYLIVEFCEHGDLREYIVDNKISILNGNDNDTLNSRRLLKWAYEAAKGMNYLAKNQIMHGDLAARNVLIAEGPMENYCPVAKVADFGLAKKFYTDVKYEKTSRMMVPWKWMAIEYLKDDFFTLKSDVWSYGVLFWEVLSFGRNPYGPQEFTEVLTKLEKGDRLTCPPGTKDITSWSAESLYREVSNACFIADYEKRAGFADVVTILEAHLTIEEKTLYNEMNEIYQSTKATNYMKIGSSKN
jgi:serine/threonine protein kinase